MLDSGANYGSRMNRSMIDDLYHLLRKVSLSEDDNGKQAILGLASHLTKRYGDYIGLLRFLDYYGTNFVLKDAIRALELFSLSPRKWVKRVVELGAGFGWLGRGIAAELGDLPTLFVDKRQWALIDIVADIETNGGARRVLDELEPGDLIVMADLVHCLDDPIDKLSPFLKWPCLIVEFDHTISSYRVSYREQIRAYGCKPITSWAVFMSKLASNVAISYHISYTASHMIVTIEPK